MNTPDNGSSTPSSTPSNPTALPGAVPSPALSEPRREVARVILRAVRIAPDNHDMNPPEDVLDERLPSDGSILEEAEFATCWPQPGDWVVFDALAMSVNAGGPQCSRSCHKGLNLVVDAGEIEEGVFFLRYRPLLKLHDSHDSMSRREDNAVLDEGFFANLTDEPALDRESAEEHYRFGRCELGPLMEIAGADYFSFHTSRMGFQEGVEAHRLPVPYRYHALQEEGRVSGAAGPNGALDADVLDPLWPYDRWDMKVAGAGYAMVSRLRGRHIAYVPIGIGRRASATQLAARLTGVQTMDAAAGLLLRDQRNDKLSDKSFSRLEAVYRAIGM